MAPITITVPNTNRTILLSTVIWSLDLRYRLWIKLAQDVDALNRASFQHAVITSIRRALQPYQRSQQVALAGAVWLATANNAWCYGWDVRSAVFLKKHGNLRSCLGFFAFGKKSPMVRRDFSRAVPETLRDLDGRWLTVTRMVEVDGETDARLGELSGGGARAYDVAFVTPGPTVDGGRSMVDGCERLYRWRWVHGVPRATAPMATCATKSVYEPSPTEDISNVGRRRFQDHAVQARRP
jgi:hypothetical protein